MAPPFDEESQANLFFYQARLSTLVNEQAGLDSSSKGGG